MLFINTVGNLGHSIPAAIIAAIAIIVALTGNFPYHGQSRSEDRKPITIFSKATLGRVDFLGATLILTATLLFVAALEEAGRKYPWKLAYVISFLSISGILWILFLAWERKVSLASTVQEPVFPWRFVRNRTLIGKHEKILPHSRAKSVTEMPYSSVPLGLFPYFNSHRSSKLSTASRHSEQGYSSCHSRFRHLLDPWYLR